MKMRVLIKKYKEIVMYLIFGLSTTLVNWVVYALLIQIVDANMTLSNAIAWFAAVIFAFVTNKIWVFESKSWKLALVIREGISFLGARVFTGLIEIFIPAMLYSSGIDQSIFGIKGFVAKVLVSVVVVILNYIVSKMLVFRNGKGLNVKQKQR